MFISEIREQFLKALPSNEGDISEWAHPEKGPTGETLKTHFWLRRGDPRRLLVSISGLHGAEAFIGSRIQAELLRSRELWENPNPPTVLFIHNANPFGSAWVRRTNASNVDLNRNSWSELPRNLEFARYHSWVSAKTAAGFWAGLLMTTPDLRFRSANHIGGIIAGGQSEFEDSIFYSGRETSIELRHLESFLRTNFPESPEQVFSLDIHTGLGPPGAESLIIDPPISAETAGALTRLFRTKLIRPDQETGFHPAVGTLGNLFTKVFPQARISHVTDEFGTLNPLFVLRNLVLENSAWHHEGPNAPGRFELLLETFYPASKSWQDATLKVGVQRFRELYHFL